MLYTFKHARRAAIAIGAAAFAYNSCNSTKAKLSNCYFSPNDTEFNFEPEVRQLRKLKNGSRVPKEQIAANMLSFYQLLKCNPVALQEMLQKCKDKEYSMHSDTKTDLKFFKLLDRSGNPDPSACDVLLSSVRYYGANIVLDTPYASKPRQH